MTEMPITSHPFVPCNTTGEWPDGSPRCLLFDAGEGWRCHHSAGKCGQPESAHAVPEPEPVRVGGKLIEPHAWQPSHLTCAHCGQSPDASIHQPSAGPAPKDRLREIARQIVDGVAAVIQRNINHHEIERDGFEWSDECFQALLKEEVVKIHAAIEAVVRECADKCLTNSWCKDVDWWRAATKTEVSVESGHLKEKL